jgi:acetylxylan esterase
MKLMRAFLPGLIFAATAFSGATANAASLQQVNGWGVSGLPSDVTMYMYVPDSVAANPPILALIHYCGGTASAVFGQAQGGGIVRAADQYGFIIVAPSSGRCWDVQSNKTRMRDGLGDSHAIRQMVKYALETRNGNAQRVYATGDSSGGMMTELLLALYPDVFKGGAAFAGMPAGCRGASESGSGGGYSGQCAGGTVTHTAQEWGDLVRGFYPGYTGHRPRVQLFHGDNDTTIRFANHTEAIKEWTNVLGLSTTPTSTSTLTLGTHQATRQRWQNACGYVVLDAFTSMGGDHGPSDALFPSQYVIPFLGLDSTAAVDPEITQCGAGGGGAGGAGGAGGRASGGAGGASSGGSAGRGGAMGGGGTNGGESGGGAGNSGGAGAGGTSGGTAGAGGATGDGGIGGTPPVGGTPGVGGSPSGGATATGGSTPSGGTSAGGATSGAAGTSGSAGASGTSTGGESSGGDESEPSGCGCVVAGADSRPRAALSAVALGLVLAALRRRRRRI